MRNDVLLAMKKTMEEVEGLTILSLFAKGDTVFGVYVNDVEESLSFLALPKHHIETTVDNINIQFFELGALLNHIYFNGALKFIDILCSSDNIIDPLPIFLELCDFVQEHIPFNVAKVKIIEAINKINDYEYDNEDDVTQILYLRDQVVNFWTNLLNSDKDVDELQITITDLNDKSDFLSLCNNLNRVKQGLNNISFNKISEKDMNLLNEMYVEIQIQHLKL